MMTWIRQILRDQSGATAVEYGLILAMIVIAMLVALNGLGNQTSSQWGYVSSQVDSATNTPRG